LMVNHLLKVLY